MKVLIIRHGDPNYALDTLTEKGWQEAEYLAERIAPMNIKAYYVSPMGRAQDTASVTLKKAGRVAQTYAWLREFDIPIKDMTTGQPCQVWELRPEDWTAVPEFYEKDRWYHVPVMKENGVKERWEEVCCGLDRLLEQHGYKREEIHYRAVQPNDNTIVLFCHFGVTCAMLGHLLGISPMLLWNGFSLETTAVTTLVTKEGKEGIAAFHVCEFGDVSHIKEADTGRIFK